MDDHPAFRFGLAKLLQRERDLKVAWDVGSVSDLDARLVSQPVDLVLMDLTLANDEDSLAATRALISNSRAKVLVISASLEPGAATAARRSGASGYIPKDVALSEIVATVRRTAAARNRRPTFTDLLASRNRDQARSDSAGQPLSRRENEVLRELRRGFTNKEMAARMGVSVPTINKHVQKVLKKLQVRNRSAAVALRYPDRGAVSLSQED